MTKKKRFFVRCLKVMQEHSACKHRTWKFKNDKGVALCSCKGPKKCGET